MPPRRGTAGHLPSPGGSGAWPGLPAALWPLLSSGKRNLILSGVFQGLGIKLNVIAEDSVNLSRGDGIMQLPTLIRSHWTGKKPNRNFQRSVTKHKALAQPQEENEIPKIQPLVHVESCKRGGGQQGSRPDKPFRLSNLLMWEFWGVP